MLCCSHCLLCCRWVWMQNRRMLVDCVVLCVDKGFSIGGRTNCYKHARVKTLLCAHLYIWLSSIGSHLSSSFRSRVNDHARVLNEAVMKGCLCCQVSGSCSLIVFCCLAACFNNYACQLSGFLCNDVAIISESNASFAQACFCLVRCCRLLH